MVFLVQTPSVLEEAGPGGVEAAPKDRGAGLNLGPKVAGGSRQRGVQRRWQGLWLEPRPLQLLLTLLMDTVFLKVAYLRPALCSLLWADPVPALPSTPVGAPLPRPKGAAPPPRAPTSSTCPTATTIHTITTITRPGRYGKARVPPLLGSDNTPIAYSHCEVEIRKQYFQVANDHITFLFNLFVLVCGQNLPSTISVCSADGSSFLSCYLVVKLDHK